MATKTISIDIEAYDRLKTARLQPNESFSRVIKRAHWNPVAATGADLLAVLEASDPLPDPVLKRLEKAQKEDSPPDDPWKR